MDPFHCTTDPVLKFVPSTVKVKATLPAANELGPRLVSVGTALTLKNTPFELPPPGGGLDTVTLAAPPMATSLPGMAAVN